MAVVVPVPPYVLRNATVPVCVLHRSAASVLRPSDVDASGCALVDITVDAGGVVTAVGPAAGARGDAAEAEVDLRAKLVLPTLCDLHTHIDKGHTWKRSPNPDGSRDGAFTAAGADAQLYTEDDLRRRVDFSLRCAYAYGTSALRTHVVTLPGQAAWVWPIMAEARAKWAGRVELQLVGMVFLSLFAPGGAGPELAKLVASHGGLLGGSLSQLTTEPEANKTSLAHESLARQGGAHGGVRSPQFPDLLEAFFQAAVANDMDIDLHVDENGDDGADGLLLVAQTTILHGWQGRVTVGHVCALALLPEPQRVATIAAVKAAKLNVVSLPTVNMYLQDRVAGRTPRWRGVTLLHELSTAGVPVSVASDNTRDAFYQYGDLDMLETFQQAVKIAHLDHPHGAWLTAATSTPASAMGLPHGVLAPGRPADCIVTRARNFNELLSRHAADRAVLRSGRQLTCGLPDYEELDDLMARA